jgi:hypothetical protein
MAYLFNYKVRQKNSNLIFMIKAFIYVLVFLCIIFFAFWDSSLKIERPTDGVHSLKWSTMSANTLMNNSTNVTLEYTSCAITSIPWPERCVYAMNNSNCNYYVVMQYCQFYSLQPLWYTLVIPYVIILLYSLGNIADTYVNNRITCKYFV